VNERFSYFLLHNFWRLTGALAGLSLGLLWAFFGWDKALVILVAALLGYVLGKRRDEHAGKAWIDRKPE
jgi:uncharacterized membrane protein